MTFIVPILEMSLQKDSISSLSHIMLAVDLEENSDQQVSVLFDDDDDDDTIMNMNLFQNQYLIRTLCKK